MRRKTLLFLVLMLFAVACRPQRPQDGASSTGTLAIFAAASLSDAFKEIGRRFEATYPGSEIAFNFAGSQQLAQQLAQGAPGDVFASADDRQMAVALAGSDAGAAVRSFAHNRLVIVTPPDNPAGIHALQDLSRPDLNLLLADETVPAGAYAREVLQKVARAPSTGATFDEEVLQNVVSYEQNVRAVLTKVALGEADAGVVYASDAREAQVHVIPIGDPFNVTTDYRIVALAASPHPALAQDFVDFVLSSQGQAILADYGFTPLSQPRAK